MYYSCIYERKYYSYKNNIGKGSYTITILGNKLPPTIQWIAHRQRTGKCLLLKVKRFKFELVVFLGCKLLPIPLSDIHH